jgi:hypothetical protein
MLVRVTFWTVFVLGQRERSTKSRELNINFYTKVRFVRLCLQESMAVVLFEDYVAHGPLLRNNLGALIKHGTAQVQQGDHT